MGQFTPQNMTQLREILHRTSEFIAYFELAETKMLAWRQEIEHCAATQQQQLTQQLDTLHNEFASIQALLAQNDLTRFRTAAENTLLQGKEHILTLQNTGRELLRQFNHQREELTALQESAKQHLAQQLTQSIEQLEAQSTRYNIQQFHQLTTQQCESMKKITSDTLVRNHKLLRLAQWRTVALTCVTTLITTLIVSLYLSNEYPWEAHQRVYKERQAGQILLHAWPQLSSAERSKIIQHEQTS